MTMTDCEKCGKDLDEHPMIDVSNVKVLQMCDRHPKWQRVEPGTVIPAGQPYRVERTAAHDRATEYTGMVKEWVAHVSRGDELFVDSSWRPTLVLPTEPTWGIAWHASHGWRVGRWCLNESRTTLEDSGPRNAWQGVSGTADFIPLTEEQVQRIEAAR